MHAWVIITGSQSHSATCMYAQVSIISTVCISHPGCLLVLFCSVISVPALHCGGLCCTSWDAGTEILSWSLQSTLTQLSQQEGRSTNSILESRFTRTFMVNLWTPWLAEGCRSGCRSMEHFKFIQRLLYSIFAQEAIIDSPHLFLTLSMDRRS